MLFCTTRSELLKDWYNQKWNRDWQRPEYQPIEFVSVVELVKDYEQDIGECRFYQSMSPKIQWSLDRTLEQHKRLDGPVSRERKVFPSEEAATEYVKGFAKELGADVVGTCLLDPTFVYKGHNCPHRYAIALGMKMNPEKLKDVPFSSNYESMRVYYELGRVTVAVGEHIRELGYRARAHHPRGPDGTSLVNHIPIAWRAGLGELGRYGSLISPVLGAWFRLGTVTTDLPLRPDDPMKGEILDFCRSCIVCARHCPGDAISYGPMVVANGVVRWVVDTEKCVPYFRDLGSCAICIQVCPWNAKALDPLMRQEYLKDAQRWKGLKGEAYRSLPVLANQPDN